MIKETIGYFNQPVLEVITKEGGSVQLSFFAKSEKQNVPRATINYCSMNPHGLGYSAYIEEGNKRKDYNKYTYIDHINKTKWITPEEKVILIDFINRYLSE